MDKKIDKNKAGGRLQYVIEEVIGLSIPDFCKKTNAIKIRKLYDWIKKDKLEYTKLKPLIGEFREITKEYVIDGDLTKEPIRNELHNITGGCLECLKKDAEIKRLLYENIDLHKKLEAYREELSDRDQKIPSG